MENNTEKNIITGMNDESHKIKQEAPDSPCSKNQSYNNNNNNNNENSNNNDNNNNETNNNNNNNNNNKEQDRFLPIANVGRIMKKVIPPNGKISKEAKETVQECVSEFISFITGEASDKCQREKRKTINGDDIIWAITTLGFEDYVNPLKVYLNKFRELEGEKLNVPKQQQRSAEQLHHIPHHHHHHQRLLSHHHHHHHDQFQHIDQGLSSHFGTKTSAYSSNNNTNTLLFPNQPSFSSQEQSFSLPFSQTSMQKNYQHHQEQIDSVGHW